jgi:P4 family phage/plasmid primase-like protien
MAYTKARLTPWFNPCTGKPRPITEIEAEQYVETSKNIDACCEFIEGGKSKIYLDLDIEKPLNDTYGAPMYLLRNDTRSSKQMIDEIVQKIPLLQEQPYTILYRDPRPHKTDADKVRFSYRVIFDSVITDNHKQMGAYLKMLGYENDKPFDLSVYSSGRIMNSVFCVKPIDIEIVSQLKPYGGVKDIHKMLITCVDDALPIVDWDKWIHREEIKPKQEKNNKLVEMAEMAEMSEDIVKKVSILLSCISSNVDYEKWLVILMTIKSVLGDTEEAYQVATDWSATSTRFDSRSFAGIWRGIRDLTSYKIGTLIWRAKQENPDRYYAEYASIYMLRNTLWDGIEIGTHSDVANLTEKLLCGRFVYAGNDKLYHYCDGRWRLDNENRALFMFIQRDVRKTIHDKAKEYINTNEARYKAFVATSTKCGVEMFVNSTVKCVKRLITDETFIDRLDTNPSIIGFEDGVYDLEKDLFIPDGMPEHMISRSVGYKFPHDMDGTKEKEAREYVESLFDDGETIRFVGKSMASTLYGENKEQRCQFWQGCGRNGKGELTNIFKNVMGEYWAELPSLYYTTAQKQGGGTYTELLDIRNARVVMTAETEGDQKFITKNFKTLTGGDTIVARGLYERKTTKFIPMCKPFIQTNHKPQFTDVDNGVLSRLVVVNFPHQYMKDDEYDETNPRHRKADLGLREKLKGMRDGFMLYLLSCYKLYRLEGLHMPNAVKFATNAYKQEVNEVAEFITNRLVYKMGSKTKLTDICLAIYKKVGINESRAISKALEGYGKFEIIISHQAKYLKNYVIVDENSDSDSENEA